MNSKKEKKCDVCGKKDITICEDGFCRECFLKKIDEKVEKYVGNTIGTNSITCPYCGSVDINSWETSENGNYCCGDCDNDYALEIDVTVTYSTYRK